MNKLQINTAKSIYDHTSSDNAPFNYFLKTILNKEKKIWNTNELVDANWNTGGTESISTRPVNTTCLIENIDWLGYNTGWYANHLAGSQPQKSEEWRRAREERGREQKQDRKDTKRGNNSNIELKLSNFRCQRNYFRGFSTKLQINAAKNTCDQTSSDKAPFNFILKIMLNKKSKKWNTNELLDEFWNKGSTESNVVHVL